MSKKFVLGMFMPFTGFRFDSGVTNSGADLFPEIAETQVLEDDASKNIVRKIRGKELYPCERVKFCDIKKRPIK